MCIAQADHRRPEQLNLQADPGFNIDLDIGFDLSAFDVSFPSSEPSSLMSPRTLASSQTSFLEDEQMLDVGPLLAVSSSHGAGKGFELDVTAPANDAANRHGTSKPASEMELEQEPALAQEPLFEVDEDGEISFHDRSDRPIQEELDTGNDAALRGEDDFQLDVGGDDRHTQALVSDQAQFTMHRSNVCSKARD